MSRLLILIVIFGSVLRGQVSSLPDGEGKAVVQRVCAQCHAVEVFTAKGNTRDGWTQVVTEMVSRGAQGSDEDFGTIVEYLTANFPPKVNINKASAAELKTSLALEQKDADAIVSYRTQNGDFKSLDDLKKVPGLDSATVDRVKQRITF